MPFLPLKNIGKNIIKDPYRYSIAIGTTVLVLLLTSGGFLLHALYLSHVQANQTTPLIALSNTRSPLIAKSQNTGQANVQQSITLAIGLRPRHQADSQQSEQAFSPDEESYQKLDQFLREAGFTVTHTYTHRLLITVSGTIGQAEKAFHTTINTYLSPGGQTYYANATDPLLPLSLAGTIESITGLNNAARGYRTLPPRSDQMANAALATAPCPVHANGYYTPDQLASAYNINGLYAAHYQGEGQSVALLELATLLPGDIAGYTACFGHSHTPLQIVHAGQTPMTPDIGIFEAELDAELILGVAPQLAQLKVYEAANDEADYLADWAQIIQDNIPIVSTSWGFCETIMTPGAAVEENSLLRMAILHGQTIIASSGDTGDNGCPPTANSAKAPIADDPGSQPYVTSVGGSSLTLKPGTSTYNDETAWNSQPTETTGYIKGGSGGGISQNWPRPAWQNARGVDNTPYSHVTICGSSACRETPDVSINADPANGYLVYCTPAIAQCSNKDPWSVAAGTSASAPMWAGIIALANQMAHKQNGSNLGFINPLLYQIANDPTRYAASFHDITKGSVTYSNGTYPAAPGFDLATGLGSCNAYGLAVNLTALAHAQHPTGK